MFDRDLFYSLCGKYHVELSDENDSAMIEDEGKMKRLRDFLETKVLEEENGEK